MRSDFVIASIRFNGSWFFTSARHSGIAGHARQAGWATESWRHDNQSRSMPGESDGRWFLWWNDLPLFSPPTTSRSWVFSFFKTVFVQCSMYFLINRTMWNGEIKSKNKDRSNVESFILLVIAPRFLSYLSLRPCIYQGGCFQVQLSFVHIHINLFIGYQGKHAVSYAPFAIVGPWKPEICPRTCPCL